MSAFCDFAPSFETPPCFVGRVGVSWTMIGDRPEGPWKLSPGFSLVAFTHATSPERAGESFILYSSPGTGASPVLRSNALPFWIKWYCAFRRPYRAMFSWPFGPAPLIADCGTANRQPQPLLLTAYYLLLPFHCPCGQPGNNMLLRRQVECNCWYHGQGNKCQNASPVGTILSLKLHNS